MASLGFSVHLCEGPFMLNNSFSPVNLSFASLFGIVAATESKRVEEKASSPP